MKKFTIFFISILSFSILVAGAEQTKHCMAAKTVRGTPAEEPKACYKVPEGDIVEPVSRITGSKVLLYMSLVVTFVLTVIGSIIYGFLASWFSIHGYYMINGLIMFGIYVLNRFIASLKPPATVELAQVTTESTKAWYLSILSFFLPDVANPGTGIFDRGLGPIFEMNIIILSLYMMFNELVIHFVIIVLTTILFFADISGTIGGLDSVLGSMSTSISSNRIAFIFIVILYMYGLKSSQQAEKTESSSLLRIPSFIFGFIHGTIICGWLLLESAHDLDSVEVNKDPGYVIKAIMWLLQPKILLGWMDEKVAPYLTWLGTSKEFKDKIE